MARTEGGVPGAEALAQQISALSRELLAFVERGASGLDLTLAQAQLLHALDQPTPMREIAGHLHCDASNVTGIVDRLEARGLVRRRTPPNDRRVKELVLTTEGRRLHDALDGLGAEVPGLRALDAAERAELGRLLTKALGDLAPRPAQDHLLA